MIIASYGEDDVPDAMNAARSSISEKENISMCLSAAHKTVENILKRKVFTFRTAIADTVVLCDYVCIVSDNKIPNKFARTRFHASKFEFVDAPLIKELSMALECNLVSYNPKSFRMMGRIINGGADDGILTDGKSAP